MPTTKFCRARNKNVQIKGGPFAYVCEDSFPVDGMCEKSKCVYHNAMGAASSFVGMLASGPGSRDDFKQVAIRRFGAIDYCD
ncbi:MAG: hypothetical protein ACLQPD_19000 [Desulfomonilaceae bacterium]